MTVPIARYALLIVVSVAGAGCGLLGSGVEAVSAQEPEDFSINTIAAPEGMRWVTCAGGEDQSEMDIIGQEGGTIGLRSGHSIVISPRAIGLPWPFFFAEVPGDGVMVAASAPLAPTLAGEGAIIRLSWANRPGCVVSDNAVIVQLPHGGTPIRHASRVDQRTKTIETTRPVTEFSLFAIAQ